VQNLARVENSIELEDLRSDSKTITEAPSS